MEELEAGALRISSAACPRSILETSLSSPPFFRDLPFLSIVPALLFLFAGLRLLCQGGRLRIDGGLVLLLASAAWGVFLALQAELMAWEKGVAGASIRVDVVLTLPAMTLVGIVGWMVFRALSRVDARAASGKLDQ